MIRNIKIFFELLTPKQRVGLFLLSLLISTAAFLEMAGMYLIYFLLTLFTKTDHLGERRLTKILETITGPLEGRTMLIFIMASIGFIFILKNFFYLLQNFYLIKFNTNLVRKLREKLTRVYSFQPYSFHLQHGFSELTPHFENLDTFYWDSQNLVNFFAEIVMFLAILIILMKVDIYSTLSIFLLGGTFVFSFYFLFRKKLSSLGKDIPWIVENINRRMIELLHGIKEVKIFHREEFFLEEIKKYRGFFTSTARKKEFILSIPRSFIESVFIVLFLGTVTLMLFFGKSEKILPLMGIYALAAFRILPALNRILTYVQTLKFRSAGLEMLKKDMQIEEKPDSNTEQPFLFQQEIQIKNAHYAYPNQKDPMRFAVQNLNFSIPKGKSVAFIGKSGSGKSTLFDLLLGLLEPGQGEILVDGVNIQQNLVGWRKIIGYIPQMIYLSDSTILENVAFGIPIEEIDRKAVNRALQNAQMEEFVATLPQGVETRINERGLRLSGGQRQRIGIARALYYEPEILFLDEATASLDNETESAVIQAINTMHNKKTIVVIAHRLSTIINCDQVYVMQEGKIVFFGTYAKTMEYLETNKTTDFFENLK